MNELFPFDGAARGICLVGLGEVLEGESLKCIDLFMHPSRFALQFAGEALRNDWCKHRSGTGIEVEAAGAPR